MSSSLTTEAPAADFICGCEWWMSPACKGLPFYKEHEGKKYCVLHYPGKDKSGFFIHTLERKLAAEDFDFRGVWFPDSILLFSRYTFTAPANFDLATFNSEVYFNSAMFSAEVSFNLTKFNARVSFDSATFNADVSFSITKFNSEAIFYSATFKDYVRFAGNRENHVFGDNSSLDLQFARIEKPERFSFHTLTLRPHWFVNVDSRKFEFIAVEWNWHNVKIKQEIKSLQSKNISPAHHLLELACRSLALNAEENHRYERASRFRYMAMEVRRLEGWQGWRNFASWMLNWGYLLASGYGERVGQAFLMLLGIWLLAAALYTQVGFARWEPRIATEKEAAAARRDEVGEPLRPSRALTYSLGVMTLQKPEPRPATNAAQSLVMLETILGPVQAALLVLAIRRKFMR